MSPLDNHAFGIAKAKMRSNRVDETDRIEPSLVFLNALDSIAPEQVRAMWDRNFLLQHDEIAASSARFCGRQEKMSFGEQIILRTRGTLIAWKFWV
jgi:hypothetical protein